jgi:integrase
MDTRTPGEIINGLAVGGFAKLAKVTPAGSLEVRKLASGTTFYWRVTLAGKTERVIVGIYDSKAAPKSLEPTARGYSVAAAIRAAEALAKVHKANLSIGGHRGVIEAEAEAARLKAEAEAKAIQVQAVAEAEAIREADARKQDAEQYSLDRLMGDYCDYQKSIGRTSYKDALSIFKLHITDAWPKLAALPANQVTPEQVADMMRRLIEMGKGRTGNKLRTYLAAAYAVAKAVKTTPSIPIRFKSYSISVNPAAETAADKNQNNPDKNPFSAKEMRDYWQIIKPMPGFEGAILRLHLLTGGQRIEQLVRLKTADVTDKAITLYDGKGRPGKAPRPHSVPLVAAAATAMAECKPKGVYAISTDGGKTHLAATTLSRWALAAAKSMPGFRTKRIRSGVETLLASARISTEIRGRIQSHGISGVQARHYDGYDYIDEKRGALEILFKLLDEPEVSTVIQFPMVNKAA